MKVMMIVKATKESEAGVLPTESMLAAMADYNQKLADAGMLLDLNGLKASSLGARVRFKHGKRTVVDGPFAETKELIAGYWMIQVKSLEEAVEWAKRVPFDPGTQQPEAEIEIRPVFELEDFAPGDAVDHHRKIGEQLESKK